MALSLVIYPTEGYNSFATLVEADAIIETTVSYTTWAGLTDDEKMRYLITATRNIEALDGITLPAAVTDCLKEAQSLMSIHDVSNGISTSSNSGDQIQTAKVGSISVTYTNGSPANKVSLFPKPTIKCLEDLGAIISDGFRFNRA